MGILAANRIKCALSCHITVRPSLQFWKIFCLSISLSLSISSLSFQFNSLHAMILSSQVYSVSIIHSHSLYFILWAKQTSINDCLPRNIDDLTNSVSVSTLYIFIHSFHMYELRLKISVLDIIYSFFIRIKSTVIIDSIPKNCHCFWKLWTVGNSYT